MTVDIFYIGFSIFVFNFHNGLALSHEYCLGPLNKSDCGFPATPVVSYYKPGSRCEIEFWRGCPTVNKFDDEFMCSHFCVGKLWGRMEIESNEVDSEDRCFKPLDKNDCGSKPTTVYTFDDNSCQPAVWRGCRSSNMFKDNNECLASCQPTFNKWKEGIQSLNQENIEEIDNFLDDVVEIVQKEIQQEAVTETVTDNIEKLAIHQLEPSAEAEVEVEQEEVTEAAAEEPLTEEPVSEGEVTEPPPAETDDSGVSEVVII